jgi:hypothetical protein
MIPNATLQDFQADRIRPGASSDPETDFNCCCDWLEALLAREPELPGPAPDARNRAAELCALQSDSAEDASCWVCGASTRFPLLCSACLDNLENLPDDPACPWLIGRDWCAAPVDLVDGELVKVRCEAALSCCEQRALLSRLGAGAGR